MYYYVDLPAIISGEWLCFMDPQEKIWEGDPGQKFHLASNNLQTRNSFLPFEFSDQCCLDSQSHYNGALMRFPLRNKHSDLSAKLCTVADLYNLLQALKDDAAVLLLFLKHIEKIDVFTINEHNLVTNIFAINSDTASEYERREQKRIFFNKVINYYSNPTLSTIPYLQYEVTITVQDVQARTKSDYAWIVLQWVGCNNNKIMDTSLKVCSLPWIGLAVPLTMYYPSRLLCFLPLPNNEDVNPPLPVCVHGTFGLNKDRRHLKWITSDMKNDDGALWNKLLLSNMLPYCYVKCLDVLKQYCKPEKVYSYWPCTSVVNNTNWKIILKPLLPLLLQGQYFWSENGRWVGLDSSVCVLPQVNGSQCPKVVIDVLIRCGKTVVVLPDNVWEAISFIYEDSYPFTIVTSFVVRKVVKGNPQRYINLSRVDKFQLLSYCLDDENYDDLNGLILLPTVAKTFVTQSAKRGLIAFPIAHVW